MKIFASTMIYALGKMLGFQGASEEFSAQVLEPTSECLPAARLIARLRELGDVQLYVDCEATCIAKARSRAFDEFLRSGCDVWVAVDDDVDASAYTLAMLLEAVQEPRPDVSDWLNGSRLVLVPCRLRGQVRVNVALPMIREARGNVTRCDWGGAALFALTLQAARVMHDRYLGDWSWVDGDGRRKVAVFAETLSNDQWQGEDVAFCQRASHAGVTVEALLVGVTVHDGQGLALEDVERAWRLDAASSSNRENESPPAA